MGARMWSFILFYVGLNLSLTMFASPELGLTPGGNYGSLNYTVPADTLQTPSPDGIGASPQEAGLAFTFAGWVTAFIRAVDVIKETVFGLPSTLERIGVPTIATTPFYVLNVYSFAWLAIQILRGMNLEGRF